MNKKRTIFTTEIDFDFIIETSIKLRDFINGFIDVISETNCDEDFIEDSIMIKSFYRSNFNEIIDYLTLKKEQMSSKMTKDVLNVNFDFIINRLNEIMDYYEVMMSDLINKYGSQVQTIYINLNTLFFQLNNYIITICTNDNSSNNV